MVRLKRSLTNTTKLSQKISPALIKKMQIFSLPYQSIQTQYRDSSLPENISYKKQNSLDSFLLDQVSHLIINEQDAVVLSKMIELLDDNGLFSNWSETQILLQKEFGISKRKTYDLLKIFQDLEPEGVGATSIKNFLEIQIQKHELEDEDFKQKSLKILSYENDIIDKDLFALSKKTNLTEKEIELSLNFIKNNLVYTLPRKQFDDQSNSVVKPSASVSVVGNIFKIEMLEKYEYVKNTEVLAMLQERIKTLESILTIFFQKQRPSSFLHSGIFKPITQKQISDITGLSSSTVSRIVNSKYILLQNNVILLKSLFQRQVNNSNYSSVFLKNYLSKNLTKTDKIISAELEIFGLSISRRTVNYYRNKFF